MLRMPFTIFVLKPSVLRVLTLLLKLHASKVNIAILIIMQACYALNVSTDFAKVI